VLNLDGDLRLGLVSGYDNIAVKIPKAD
jgi:hypothetical protein